MRARPLLAAATLAFLLTGCQLSGTEDTPDVSVTVESDTAPGEAVTMYGDGSLPTDDEVEAARFQGRGRAGMGIDTAAVRQAERTNPETAASIDSVRTWSAGLHLPLGGNVEGPSVLKAQVLLDRAGFSPGEIDGRWGDNTEMAVAWFQKSASLPSTGIIDAATSRALGQRAGRPTELVVARALSAEDVQGAPFETLPSDVYARAELDRQGFESLAEKLGERFHAAPALLRRLNPDVTLDSLAQGDTLRVPNVLGAPRIAGSVSRLVVSGGAGYLHALAADGTVLFHAPVTLGSSYDPSPDGDLSVTGVARNPSWHFQPAILSGHDSTEADAILPPGPNNAVGTVWMSLSKPHYGIHGTSAPGTIGTATSSGCVRLTNWDVERLAGMVRAGTPVRFRDVTGRPSGRDSTQTASRSTAPPRASAPSAPAPR